MHELLLFGQVPSSRHDQVLSILAGIAAMQPQPVVEKHLLFKPAKSTPGARSGGGGGPTGAVQGVSNAQIQALQAQTQGDLFYLQLVADLDATTGSKERGDGPEGEDEAIPRLPTARIDDDPSAWPDPRPEKWTLQFRDLPEVAGRRPVTSRLMFDLEFQSGDPLALMSALDYTPTSTYHLSGHRLSHLSTSLLLFRLSRSPAAPSLLDPSGSYILQAALRVQDGGKPELMTRGIGELLALKESLRGVVEMGVGERLGLDTRVR